VSLASKQKTRDPLASAYSRPVAQHGPGPHCVACGTTPACVCGGWIHHIHEDNTKQCSRCGSSQRLA
jgi:hypothetical protein